MIVWAHPESDGALTLQCPFCKAQKRIVPPQIDRIATDSKVKTKCSCGETFFLALDKRRHSRKHTELTGGFFHRRREYRGLIHILDLSKSGIGIELDTDRIMLQNDKLVVRFNLDDERRTYIEKEAKVKRNKGKKYGLEFNQEAPDQDPLDHYLQF
jgi:hypothetical protein